MMRFEGKFCVDDGKNTFCPQLCVNEELGGGVVLRIGVAEIVLRSRTKQEWSRLKGNY